MENLQPKLRFPEFKEDWINLALKDCVTFHNNKRIPLKDSERNKLSKVYPYYGASGIIDYVDNYLFDGEYILLGEDGANILTRSTRLVFIAKGKFWVNNHAHVFCAKNNFHNYFLSECLEKIDYSKYNSGTAQPKLNSKVVSGLPLNVPSFEEQTKIADFLGAVDKQLNILNQKKEKLNLYKKGVMQQLFSQQIRFKDDNGNNYPDWQNIILGNEVNLKHGYQFRSSDFTQHGVPVIKIGNVIGNDLNLTNLSFISKDRLNEFKNFIINKGDILMSLTGNIGRVVEVNYLPFKMLQNYRVGNFIPNEKKINKKFLKHLLMSDFVFGKFNNLSNQSAQANFGKQDMDKIIVGLPSLVEQTKIANFLSAIDNQIETVENQITKTETYKKGLLQQMFV